MTAATSKEDVVKWLRGHYWFLHNHHRSLSMNIFRYFVLSYLALPFSFSHLLGANLDSCTLLPLQH